jgi:hypothetical protein
VHLLGFGQAARWFELQAGMLPAWWVPGFFNTSRRSATKSLAGIACAGCYRSRKDEWSDSEICYASMI